MRAAYAEHRCVSSCCRTAATGTWPGRTPQLTEMPVTTVAEALPGPDFAAFVAFRERLGMQVLSHRDPAVIGELIGGRTRRAAGLPARGP